MYGMIEEEIQGVQDQGIEMIIIQTDVTMIEAITTVITIIEIEIEVIQEEDQTTETIIIENLVEKEEGNGHQVMINDNDQWTDINDRMTTTINNGRHNNSNFHNNNINNNL